MGLEELIKNKALVYKEIVIEERAGQGKGIKMLGNAQLITMTLNVSGMNSPIKWKQIAEWIRNQNPTICCLQETHMRQVDTYKIKIKGWSKINWASNEKKKAGVEILISDKAKVKLNLVQRDREGNYILIKDSINNEEIAIPQHVCTKW